MLTISPARAQVNRLSMQLQNQPLRRQVKSLEVALGRATQQRDGLDGQLVDATNELLVLRSAAAGHDAQMNKVHKELEVLNAAAAPFVRPAAAVPTAVLQPDLLRLQQRVEELQKEVAERQAGPPLHVPDGTVCPVCFGDNTPEVEVGCGKGHFMCRPCYWVWCEHARGGGDMGDCPLCRARCLLPPR
jgi:hypothetical protein